MKLCLYFSLLLKKLKDDALACGLFVQHFVLSVNVYIYFVLILGLNFNH